MPDPLANRNRPTHGGNFIILPLLGHIPRLDTNPTLEILNEFPKVLDNVSWKLRKQRDQFKLSIENKLDNPLATIKSFNRQFQIGEKERESVEWDWTQEPP